MPLCVCGHIAGLHTEDHPKGSDMDPCVVPTCECRDFDPWLVAGL